MGLGDDTHRELEVALARMNVASPSGEQLNTVQRAIDRLGEQYEPEDLQDGLPHQVRNVNVPVFGLGGEVDLLLSVYGLPEVSTVADIERYAATLGRASERISRRVADLTAV